MPSAPRRSPPPALSPAEGHTDLRLCGDRGLRLGDGGEGRVRAVRRRHRRTRRAPRPKRRWPRPPIASSATTCRLRRPRSSIRPTPRRWPRSRTARPKTDGVATGEDVADRLIALRADDGFRAPVTYTPPNPPVPGAWIPTAPTPPVGPYLGPDGALQPRLGRPVPPRAGRRRCAARSGPASTTRSKRSAPAPARPAPPNRPLAARFWAEPPVQQARGSFRKFVLDHQLDIVQAARFMAMISVTYADALIACFDAKYHYTFWRPITAIRAGDTDGNAATVGDAAWTPLLPGHAQPSRVPQRPLLHHPGRGTGHRPVPRDPTHRLHRPQPDRPGRPSLPPRQGPRSRGGQRPHLGRHPLPLRRRHRGQDQRDRSPTRCSPTTSSAPNTRRRRLARRRRSPRSVSPERAFQPPGLTLPCGERQRNGR